MTVWVTNLALACLYPVPLPLLPVFRDPPSPALCNGSDSGSAQQHALPPTTPVLAVLANSLEMDAHGRSTGHILGNIKCARDKSQAFEDLLLQHQGRVRSPQQQQPLLQQRQQPSYAPLPGGRQGQGTSVYMGDSCTDLLPLLQVRGSQV